MDLVPYVPGLHPVGRLDLDSEGLLLLTTDGQLTLQLTHPRYEHEKEYRVWCTEGDLTEGAVRQLVDGVDLEDGQARAARARTLNGGGLLVLREGRNRQVRRMLEAVGYTVERLLRTRIGGLSLGDLEAGAHRELGDGDLAELGYTPGQIGTGS
jgi:23S rRNA pseudouridine2605 synthase